MMPLSAGAVRVGTVVAPGTDADSVRDLFLQYGESLGYNTCFAGFEQELLALPGDYAPTRGGLWLARSGDDAAGCVGLRPFDHETGEMKRLYVRPEFRGSGLGRRLAEAAVVRASELGYRRIVLDTLPSMREARALYAALGFRACAPCFDNSLLGSDCFELAL